eukprot:5899360-Prymnesium_polylepis.1
MPTTEAFISPLANPLQGEGQVGQFCRGIRKVVHPDKRNRDDGDVKAQSGPDFKQRVWVCHKRFRQQNDYRFALSNPLDCGGAAAYGTPSI